MGGFEVPSTGSVLDFTGTKYDGLEVSVDEASVGALLEIMEDLNQLSRDGLEVETVRKVFTRLTDNFGEVLEDWNATRKGVPVPPTAEGLRRFGITFVTDVISAWITGTAQADEELGKDSTSGETSPEEQTAAAALSRSLPSLPPPKS